MTHEQLAARIDAAFVNQEMERRFSAALWLLRRRPTLQRTLRAIRRHVRRAHECGVAVDRSAIAQSLCISLATYEKRFSLIKSILGIRL